MGRIVDHDGFKVKWIKSKPIPPDKKKVIIDFIFTYIYPVYPLSELLGIYGGLLAFFPFFLIILNVIAHGDTISVAFGNLAAVLGTFLLYTSLFLFVNNITLAYSIFWISLISVYILGYYQIFKRYKK